MIMKMRKQGLAMIHTHYDKVINMEKSVDVFARLHTRKLEQKNFALVVDLSHCYT